jgi:putative FmdB family regulatory protein
MPTYEYECQGCGHRFELFQKITAEAVKECPNCGKNKAKRLISAGAGIIFKGSGFYATDYKKGHQVTRSPGHLSGKNAVKCDKAGSSPACGSCEGSKSKSD